MRVGLNLVDKYGLGQPSGFGAIISVGDLDDLGHVVQRHPEYEKSRTEINWRPMAWP